MIDPELPLHLFGGYGIELEYMIVDRDQLTVLPVTDEVLKSVAGEYVNDYEEGPIAWSNELVLHVLELKTNGPAATLRGLSEQFTNNIGRINKILDKLNGRLMPTAMHPWMDPYKETRLWPHEANEIYDTYNRIFDCRGHGWSNLQSTHINLPFADDGEFAILHTAIRALLPVMPALAASSPIVDGEFSGFMDTRLEVYRHNADRIPWITGQVIPEQVNTRKEYQDKILQPMFDAIAPHDPSAVLQHEWLNSRGAIARFDRNAIEIRVIDTQETSKADIAIAALITGVLRKLAADDWTDITQQSGISTESLAGIFTDNIRNADQSVIKNREYLELFAFPDRNCKSQDLWQYFFETVSGDEAIKDPVINQSLQFILGKGCLARRIKKAIGNNVKRTRIEETYRMLCECLEQEQLFEDIG